MLPNTGRRATSARRATRRDDAARARRPAGDGAASRRDAELRVAAALSRRPFGVRSSRQVAQLAGLGQPATVRALRRLVRAGVVRRRSDLVAADAARTVTVWAIEWRSEAWHAIAAEVGQVHLPAAPPTASAPGQLPGRLAHLFWQGDVRTVCPERHGHLVASRILRSDDCQALGWLAANVRPVHLLAASEGRGLDRRRATLARLLAAQHPDTDRG